MMGSRGWKGAAECDALSKRYRRLKGGYRPGIVKALKRKYWKRTRREAKLAAREEARTL
jgi:hypothetical protein